MRSLIKSVERAASAWIVTSFETRKRFQPATSVRRGLLFSGSGATKAQAGPPGVYPWHDRRHLKFLHRIVGPFIHTVVSDMWGYLSRTPAPATKCVRKKTFDRDEWPTAARVNAAGRDKTEDGTREWSTIEMDGVIARCGNIISC